MGLNAGTAFIDIKPNLSKTFAASLGTKLTSVLPGLGTTAGKLLAGGIVGGATIAGGALVTLGAKGVTAFADLERGINEVGTLLPDLDKGGLAALRDRTQEFAREVGLTTTQVVPALYQAISAGVPQDNVFEFLETANKAAVAGVTDIETAVDGLTTIVNAYGSDVITAGEASDLLFTAVAGGKTTFDELSNSLFNVAPVAAGLGVPLSDVTASLQAITAQGTPTSVATTQLRQALVELGKQGSKVSDIFEETAGQSFGDFIASGGDLEGALDILQDASAETGLKLTDMFGSVEAGNAILQLTSDNGAQLFQDALADMSQSAGATDGAFETMDQGLARSWDRIKATFQVTLTEIGERLAPFVENVLDFIADKLPGAVDFLIGVFETLAAFLGPIFSAIGSLFSVFSGNAEGATAAAGGAFSTFGGIVATVIDTVRTILAGLAAFWAQWGDEIIAAVRTAFDTIAAIVGTVADIIKTVLGGLADFWAQWGDEIVKIVGFVASFLIDTIGAALDIVKGIIQTVLGVISGDWSKAWDGIKLVFSGVWEAIETIVRTIFEAISLFIGSTLETIGQIWNQTWQAISDFFAAIWETIDTIVRTIFSAISGFIGDTVNAIATTWSNVWQGIADFFASIWGTIDTVVRTIFSAISGFISETLAAIASVFSATWNGIRDTLENTIAAISNFVVIVFKGILAFFGTIWEGIKTVFSRGVDAVFTFIKELPGKILGLGIAFAKAGADLAANLVSGILGGLGGLAKALGNKLWSGFKGALGFVGGLLGISSPSMLFRDELGLPIAQGVATGVEETGNLTAAAMTGAVTAALGIARKELTGLGAASFTAATTGNAAAGAEASGIVGPATTTGGPMFHLAEGAIQVNNPEPEPASLTVPRELRRLATTLGRG